MILLIDNHDSFTYNLYQMISQLHEPIEVVKNDDMTLDEIVSLKPKAIILSPGPCSPNEAGICLDLVSYFYKKLPILGVCLGHQIICQALGGKIVKASPPKHGKLETINHSGNKIFKDVPKDFKATRYHSLVVDKNSLPETLEVTATAASDHHIMAVHHRLYPLVGLQFHPESYMSQEGHQLINNFIKEVTHVQQTL